MNIVPAQEIKRRGFAAVDDLIARGPVHVLKNNLPQYVILTEARYQELIDTEDESYIERLKTSLADVKAGRVQHFKNADELLKAIDEYDEDV